MTLFADILKVVFGILFLFAGVVHIMKPSLYKHFIPNFLPKITVNYIIGVVEFFLGLGLFFNQTVRISALGIFFLMVLFLPIHIGDVTKERPAIGSKKMAIIRVPIQFILMLCAWIIYLKS
jgi:uncharacterized membrane protein